MGQRHSQSIELDPFKLVSSQTRDACVMEDVNLFRNVLESLDQEKDPRKRQRVPDDFSDPTLIGGSRAWSKRTQEAELFALRFWFGFIGGLALIAPMILMVLLKQYGPALSLTTVSVSTILFALSMARYSDQSPIALVATTAAYAAVLVVFVGTSS